MAALKYDSFRKFCFPLFVYLRGEGCGQQFRSRLLGKDMELSKGGQHLGT